MTEWRTCSSHGRGTSTGSQNSRRSSPEPPPLTTDHRPSWALHNSPRQVWKTIMATLFGGDAGKPLSAAALEGSMLEGPLCRCCHIPEMNSWWWFVSAAIFPDSSGGIPERHKHQTQPRRRLDDCTESVVGADAAEFTSTNTNDLQKYTHLWATYSSAL